jgi:hypothetical protein
MSRRNHSNVKFRGKKMQTKRVICSEGKQNQEREREIVKAIDTRHMQTNVAKLALNTRAKLGEGEGGKKIVDRIKSGLKKAMVLRRRTDERPKSVKRILNSSRAENEIL